MSDSSEEDKFTPAIIEEKKTRPYLLVKLFDKNVDAIKYHSLFEIGDDENDIKCFTQKDPFGTTDLMVKGYVARQFRDCIDKIDDIKTVKICINEKVLAYYDYSIPTLFEMPRTESIKKIKKIKNQNIKN